MPHLPPRLTPTLQELSFLSATCCLVLFYISTKYHQNIVRGTRVTARTRNQIQIQEGELTPKVRNQSCHSRMQHVVSSCSTFQPSKIQIIQRVLDLQSGHKIRFKHKKGDNSKSKKARVVILVCNTLSRHVLHFYQVSSKYSKGYSCYRADRESISNTRGDNSKSKKAKVVILVRDTSSSPVLHFYQCHKNISKGYSTYTADTKSMQNHCQIFLYATHRLVLFYICTKYHQNIPKGIQFTERTRNQCIITVLQSGQEINFKHKER